MASPFFPNRKALKILMESNIDAQYSQQWGSQVFNYSGEQTDEYKNLCSSFSQALSDLKGEIELLEKEIPVFA